MAKPGTTERPSTAPISNLEDTTGSSRIWIDRLRGVARVWLARSRLQSYSMAHTIGHPSDPEPPDRSGQVATRTGKGREALTISLVTFVATRGQEKWMRDLSGSSGR